jgi:hypothetical protein
MPTRKTRSVNAQKAAADLLRHTGLGPIEPVRQPKSAVIRKGKVVTPGRARSMAKKATTATTRAKTWGKRTSAARKTATTRRYGGR